MYLRTSYDIDAREGVNYQTSYTLQADLIYVG